MLMMISFTDLMTHSLQLNNEKYNALIIILYGSDMNLQDEPSHPQVALIQVAKSFGLNMGHVLLLRTFTPKAHSCILHRSSHRESKPVHACDLYRVTREKHLSLYNIISNITKCTHNFYVIKWVGYGSRFRRSLETFWFRSMSWGHGAV